MLIRIHNPPFASQWLDTCGATCNIFFFSPNEPNYIANDLAFALFCSSWGCTRSSLITGVLKMHTTYNICTAFPAHLNATGVYWDPLGPELQRHQLFKILRRYNLPPKAA